MATPYARACVAQNRRCSSRSCAIRRLTDRTGVPYDALPHHPNNAMHHGRNLEGSLCSRHPPEGQGRDPTPFPPERQVRRHRGPFRAKAGRSRPSSRVQGSCCGNDPGAGPVPPGRRRSPGSGRSVLPGKCSIRCSPPCRGSATAWRGPSWV